LSTNALDHDLVIQKLVNRIPQFLLLDDEKVHGIVLNLPLGDRYYPIEAVLELDEEDPLLGVLFVPDQ
jgi:hypothetical protein